MEDISAPTLSDDSVLREGGGECAADVALVGSAAIVGALGVDLALQLVDSRSETLALICVSRPSGCFDVSRDRGAKLPLDRTVGTGLRAEDSRPRPLVNQRLSARRADAGYVGQVAPCPLSRNASAGPHSECLLCAGAAAGDGSVASLA